MKNNTLLFTAIILSIFIASSCTKNTVTKQGVLRPLGMTTFQYGSHYLGDDTNIQYALRSSTINLKDFEFYTVQITGNFVDGYPVDGGPEFINVTSIKKIK